MECNIESNTLFKLLYSKFVLQKCQYCGFFVHPQKHHSMLYGVSFSALKVLRTFETPQESRFLRLYHDAVHKNSVACKEDLQIPVLQCNYIQLILLMGRKKSVASLQLQVFIFIALLLLQNSPKMAALQLDLEWFGTNFDQLVVHFQCAINIRGPFIIAVQLT